MRQLEKVILDQNTTGIRILEDGQEIMYEAFPSIPSFKINGITGINENLAKRNKAELTNDEKQQLQTWMNEA